MSKLNEDGNKSVEINYTEERTYDSLKSDEKGENKLKNDENDIESQLKLKLKIVKLK